MGDRHRFTIRSAAAPILLCVFTLLGCGQAEDVSARAAVPKAPRTGEVNVYSSRHYDTDLALYENFEARTGIRVNLIEAGADQLIERIRTEGEYSPADVLITVDAGRLWRAEQAGILSPAQSDVLEARVPAHLRHPDGLWFGLSKRARVIIHNVDDELTPLSTYADLANPVHAGKLCVRSSSNIYNISLLASRIARDGEAAAERWTEGVVANFARPPQSNDTGQIKAVASGDCGLSIVNSYYLARFAASSNAADKALFSRVRVVFPDQGGTGTHINISGAGIVRTAPNRAEALRFIEYLTETESQELFANGNHEYPIVAGVAPTSAVAALGAFEEDTINAAELGRNQALAVKVFDRAGWN
ncbi:MAG: Fe(3+) ABC transporter substrate-binding protein [Pseudomonadota bacterium]